MHAKQIIGFQIYTKRDPWKESFAVSLRINYCVVFPTCTELDTLPVQSLDSFTWAWWFEAVLMRQWSCRPLVALPWGLSFPAAIDKPKNDEQEADRADQGASYDDGVTVTLLFTQVMVQVSIPRY